MDSGTFLWIVRGVIISVAVVMFVLIMRWKKEGILRERFHIYFLVLNITCLILGNCLLTYSINTTLDAFYGAYIDVVGIISLIIWLFIRKLTSKKR